MECRITTDEFGNLIQNIMENSWPIIRRSRFKLASIDSTPLLGQRKLPYIPIVQASSSFL